MSSEFKPNTQVLARIAEAFSYKTEIKKTRLHSASRTDWNSFERYVQWMQEKNYIEFMAKNKENAYRLTSSGREFINVVIKLHDHVKESKSAINI